MNRFSLIWASWVVKYRFAILLITALLVALAPLSFNRLYHDNSNESYFVENDPNLVSFNKLVDRFGDPEYLILGIEAREQDEDVFNVETIQMVHALTEFLEDHRHVTQVRSLSKYQYTHDDNGMMATDDLFEYVEDLAEEPELLADAREIMAGEKLALDLLLTSDFKHTQVMARTTYRPGENAHNVELTQELRNFVDAQGYRDQGFNIHMSGMPVIGERFETLTQTDMAWINPTMGIIMVVILFIIFRSFFAMSIPLVVILMTMLLVTSIQGWLKFPFTAVNSALIPTVIILSIGTCVHVLVEFFQFRYSGKTPKEAAQGTVNDLFYAVLFTCVTTALGFIALSVTELKPVREFALLAAISPLIIFSLAMSTLPAILSFVPWVPRSQKNRITADKSQTVETILTREQGAKETPMLWLTHHIPFFTLKHRRWIAAVGALITLFSLYSVSHIRVDANVVNYFKKDSWINKDLFYFNDNFKGISNLEVIVDTGEEGGIKDPVILQRVDALQSWFTSFKETGKPTSVVDFYKQINQSLNEDNTDFYRLPSSREMAAQFLLVYESTGPDEDLTDLLFEDRYMRIRIPIVNMDETATTHLINDFTEGLGRNFADLDLELTGNLIMNNAQNRYVNNGMFRSFGIAIITIGVCFIFLFRSFKYGIIALAPSIVPVLLTGGLVSYAGIAMDLGTMIVGAMTIGIAVDDAIHLMSRYLLMRRRGFNVYEAIQFAMNSSGRAVVLTSIILVTGFSVMLLGSFVSYIYVGLFSAMIMVMALIGDIIVMPALLFLVDGDEKTFESAMDSRDLSVKKTVLEKKSQKSQRKLAAE
ncbi:efflux RND transporter permease subunit [Teredinibacter haidensis]|uniref:efflux RND transporter permease subunit n=1 Tax=Teredinibacter haidensis TaxID=2731755 RepID=UPI0009FAFDD2|nr:MMPL family transporter [Teredinibacter haidensis]